MRPIPAAAKTERLLNLVICLLYTRRPLAKEAIRKAVPQYAQTSGEAFDRMFERDKEQLRALGIPLLTEAADAYFDDEPAYRIDRREYALPEISFTPEEIAALSLAARTWTHASLAGPTAEALRKLAAAGVERDDASMLAVEPRVRTTEPAFGAVKDAVVRTYPIRFAYRRAGGEPTERHVQPWGIAAWHGRWYLTGLDTDRQAPRVFRLGRIEGVVRRDGASGCYVVPEDHEPRSMIRLSVGEGRPRVARLAVRPEQGQALRRRARPVPPEQAPSGERLEGWSVLELDFTDVERLVDEIAWYGPDVVVLAPDDARAGVVARLRASAGTAPS